MQGMLSQTPGFAGGYSGIGLDPGLLSQSRLMEARRMLGSNDPRQGFLGPLEHRAFARETVQDNPLAALPLLGMIPGYQGAKWMARGGLGPIGAAMGRLAVSPFGQDVSKPSLGQAAGGFHGVIEGLLKAKRAGGW
jgi:hypothetical protein